MKIASVSLRGVSILCVLASTVAACGDPEAQSTGSTDEVLPDAMSLQALETESFSASDFTDTAQTNLSSVIPDFCADNDQQKAYQSGEKLGLFWVKWMWKHFRCCDRVERFADALMVLVEKLDQKTNSEKGLPRCRHAGIVEGALEAMNGIETQCQTDCYNKGDAVGAVKAKTYCDQAIAASGQLQPPTWTRKSVGICGLAYEMGCDARFLGVTTSYANAQGLACSPYTSGLYSDIWDRSRLKSCDYSQKR
jgi:hypothetical protein